MKTNKGRLLKIATFTTIFTCIIFSGLVYSYFKYTSYKLHKITEETKDKIRNSPPTGIPIEKNKNEEIKTQPVIQKPIIYADPEPVLYSVVPNSVKIGDTINIFGEHLNGFEGDLEAWIVDKNGITGWLPGDRDYSTPSNIQTIIPEKVCKYSTEYIGLPCEDFMKINKGTYTLFVQTWDMKSNTLEIVIK